MRAMVQRGLQCVVVCIRNRSLQFHAAERGAELRSRSLLIEGTAKRRPEAQTQRRIRRVHFLQHQQVMGRSAHVADCGKRRSAYLTLNAGHPVLSIRGHIARVHRGNTHQRLELAPIHVGVRL